MQTFNPATLQHIINTKTKPIGALGVLEQIAYQVGAIQQTYTPAIKNPTIIVFAGDHGIALSGLVNPYPQAVTAQMVMNFIQGGAAINVFTKQHNTQLYVADAGVNASFESIQAHPTFLSHKQGMGTANYLDTEAMTEAQLEACLQAGKQIVAERFVSGCNCIGFGEMGIGNTSAASLILAAIAGISIEAATGRGTGATDIQLEVKVKTLEKVFQKHQLSNHAQDPYTLLRCIGGFEIAMMTGAYVEAAACNMTIVVDGFIATAALLLANKINPLVINNCIFAHTSGEKGHEQMLAYLEATPLLNLGMRLGEGTGAALAMPLIQSAVAFLNEMASFESAAVSTAS